MLLHFAISTKPQLEISTIKVIIVFLQLQIEINLMMVVGKLESLQRSVYCCGLLVITKSFEGRQKKVLERHHRLRLVYRQVKSRVLWSSLV